MKVGRVKDPLYEDSYVGITPPTFTPPLEPFGLGFRGSEARSRPVGKFKALLKPDLNPKP